MWTFFQNFLIYQYNFFALQKMPMLLLVFVSYCVIIVAFAAAAVILLLVEFVYDNNVNRSENWTNADDAAGPFWVNIFVFCGLCGIGEYLIICQLKIITIIFGGWWWGSIRKTLFPICISKNINLYFLKWGTYATWRASELFGL